jgi:gas vesicle protein
VKKLLSFALGLGLGATVGMSLMVLFAPTSGDELVTRLKEGWQETLAEARRASELRRAELEAELAQMRGQTLPRLPPPGGTSR